MRIKHTIKRDGIYYFNYRLSKKGYYRRSLKSDSSRECRKYIKNISDYIRKLKNKGVVMDKTQLDQLVDLLVFNKVNDVYRISKSITSPLDIDNTDFERWYQETQSQRYIAYHDDGRQEVYPYKEWLKHKKITRLKGTLFDFENTPLTNELFDPPTIEGERLSYISNCIDLHTKELIKSYQDNNTKHFREELSELEARFASLLPSRKTVSDTYINEENNSPTFKCMFNQYLEEKATKGGNTAHIKRHLNIFNFEFEDIPIDEIDLSLISDCWDTLLILPRSSKTGYGKVTLKLWEGLKDGTINPKEEQLYSSSEIKKYRTSLNQFMEWCNLFKKVIDKNPVNPTYLKVPAQRITKRALFPDKIARSIINNCIEQLSDRTNWVILLMAYHGMRTSEVVNLEKKDIILEESSKVLYINITKGKSENAIRKIPIHKSILSLNFEDFINDLKNPEERIFPFKVTKMNTHYNKIKIKLNIPSKLQDGSKISLYSFRHNFATQLKNEKTEYIKGLLGHNDTTSNYVHLDIAEDYLEFQRIVNTVRY